MEMVQEQWLQLKTRFSMGYNMKSFVLWGDKHLVGGIFPGGGRLSKASADDGVFSKVNFCNQSLGTQ